MIKTPISRPASLLLAVNWSRRRILTRHPSPRPSFLPSPPPSILHQLRTTTLQLPLSPSVTSSLPPFLPSLTLFCLPVPATPPSLISGPSVGCPLVLIPAVLRPHYLQPLLHIVCPSSYSLTSCSSPFFLPLAQFPSFLPLLSVFLFSSSTILTHTNPPSMLFRPSRLARLPTLASSSLKCAHTKDKNKGQRKAGVSFIS